LLLLDLLQQHSVRRITFFVIQREQNVEQQSGSSQLHTAGRETVEKAACDVT
jgi:hypothetical protein